MKLLNDSHIIAFEKDTALIPSVAIGHTQTWQGVARLLMVNDRFDVNGDWVTTELLAEARELDFTMFGTPYLKKSEGIDHIDVAVHTPPAVIATDGWWLDKKGELRPPQESFCIRSMRGEARE